MEDSEMMHWGHSSLSCDLETRLFVSNIIGAS